MIRSRFGLAVLIALFSAARSAAQNDRPASAPTSGSAVATALAFAHQFATPDALTPGKDRQLKTALVSALGRSPQLTWEGAGDYFDRTTFRALAGAGAVISVEKMDQLLRDKMPSSRKDMNEKLRTHADLLTTQFDMIEEAHGKAGGALVDWVVKNYRTDKPLGVVVVCTGNTRRSVLGATMGNVAAAYTGLSNVRFYSGGTAPEAINPRTIATLREIGIEIEPTGKEAPRGKGGLANPVYRVQWGKGLETTEFSKVYTDAHNPRDGFAALVVCSEAETACPRVTGADVRIPVLYLDPKAFDGAPFESAKYAERRDDIGRFMLSVFVQARRRLELTEKMR